MYPEHEKMQKVKADSQAIGAFLDNAGYHLSENHHHDTGCFGGDEKKMHKWKAKKWDEEQVAECGYVENALMPVTKSIESILAKYFNIDLDKIEKEKQQMLDVMRSRA